MGTIKVCTQLHESFPSLSVLDLGRKKKKKTFTDSVVMGEVKGDKIKTSMTCGIKNVPMSDTLICWAEILAEDVFEMHDLFDFFDGRCFKT